MWSYHVSRESQIFLAKRIYKRFPAMITGCRAVISHVHFRLHLGSRSHKKWIDADLAIGEHKILPLQIPFPLNNFCS